MVSVRFTESRSLVELSLPEASESLIGDFENEMIISIDASGNYFMEGRSLEKSELIHILKTKNGIDKQINIILEVDEAAPFGSFMMITNLLKEKSISSVNIATRIKK